MQSVHKFNRLILVISRDFSCHLKMMSGVQFASKMVLEKANGQHFKLMNPQVSEKYLQPNKANHIPPDSDWT